MAISTDGAIQIITVPDDVSFRAARWNFSQWITGDGSGGTITHRIIFFNSQNDAYEIKRKFFTLNMVRVYNDVGGAVNYRIQTDPNQWKEWHYHHPGGSDVVELNPTLAVTDGQIWKGDTYGLPFILGLPDQAVTAAYVDIVVETNTNTKLHHCYADGMVWEKTPSTVLLKQLLG
jgi:hypothetical protein